MNHRWLPSISGNPRELEVELLGAKQQIEAELGRPCHYFAWPRGQESDIDPASIQAARSAGYSAIFGASGGTVTLGTNDNFVLPRQHFEVQWPVRHLQYLAQSEKASLLKRLVPFR